MRSPTFPGRFDARAFLDSTAFVDGFKDYLIEKLREMPDEQRRQVGQVFELLTADARAAELTRRYGSVQFPGRNLTVTASVQSREPVNVLWLEKSGSRACSG